jgi:hypothetical protein
MKTEGDRQEIPQQMTNITSGTHGAAIAPHHTAHPSAIEPRQVASLNATVEPSDCALTRVPQLRRGFTSCGAVPRLWAGIELRPRLREGPTPRPVALCDALPASS